MCFLSKMLCSFLNKDLQRKVLFELNRPDLQMRNCFFPQLEQIDFKIMTMFKLHSLFRLNNKKGNLLHQNLTSVVAMSLALTLPARGAYCIYAAECIVDECTHIHKCTHTRTYTPTPCLFRWWWVLLSACKRLTAGSFTPSYLWLNYLWHVSQNIYYTNTRSLSLTLQLSYPMTQLLEI